MTSREMLDQLKEELTSLQISLSSPENLDTERIEKALHELRNLFPDDSPRREGQLRHVTIHDGEVHDPLGAGSYLFKKSFIPSILRTAGAPVPGSNQQPSRPQKFIVHIGAQPNNSPHAGTLVVFFLGFLIAREIQEYYNRSRDGLSDAFCKWIDNLQVCLQLDLVDTAPDNSRSPRKEDFDGHQYQRSLRSTQAVSRFQNDYEQVLQLASEAVKNTIPYKITRQADLTSMKCFPSIVETIVKSRQILAPLLAPDTEVLAMRAACPYEGCGGIADKHGIHNKYAEFSDSVTISFFCPIHGRRYEISTSMPEDVAKLEFNTPLRNLVRSLAYALDTVESRTDVIEGKEGAYERLHLRVTGSDYTGLYSDQVFWRPWLQMNLAKELSPPVVLYAPLIVDWAGSKLSKSLYVKNGAYEYMKDLGMDYLLSFDQMKKKGKDPLILFRLVESWVKEPKKLFRSFSADYLHMQFCEQGK